MTKELLMQSFSELFVTLKPSKITPIFTTLLQSLYVLQKLDSINLGSHLNWLDTITELFFIHSQFSVSGS
jgi:hypothetical protein